MLVEYAQAPLAIGTRTPRFSWEVPLEGRGRKQTAYRLLVATSETLLKPGKADLWDSGKVASAQSANVAYAGEALCSNMDCFWAVQVWDEAGNPGEFTAAGHFCTALFDSSDWKADWIGMGPATEPELDPYSLHQDDATSGGLRLAEDDMQKMPFELRDLKPDQRSPLLRKSFALAKPVKRARAFICGLGLFELRLNGTKVGDDVLATPRTDFRKRAFYTTYDITAALQEGENAVGIILGNGWFNAQKKHWHWQSPWHGSPRALVQLEVEYADGTTERVVSDESWQGDWSPITFSCIYDGEDYDARLEQDGWDAPGFDAAAWQAVKVVAAPGGRLTAMDHQSNRVMKRWQPKSVSEPEPGVFVFDMGTVMTGWTKLMVPQGRAGETVTLKYSELLFDSGMIAQRRSCGQARQAELYTMKGEANETYEPRFTYHGFRYVEVTGFPGTPTLETLEACFVHQGVEQAGSFECGHELINQIHACTLQSQRCNMQMGVPTDDTQREERLGWCGDAWSYAEESFYNLDTARFWTKWIADFYDQQDEESGMVGYICPLPGWGEAMIWSAAFVLIPWWHYVHYGDRRILERSYPYLKKYLAYLEKTGKKRLPDLSGREPSDLLFPKTPIEKRFSSPEEHGYLQHSWFADHLATNEGASGMGKDQPRSMATAFYHMDATVMGRIAETLGHGDDAAHCRELAGKIKDAYNETFFDAYGAYYDVGCQSAQALALCFDLVPEAQRGRVQGYLNSSVNFRQRRITSGYAGTKWVVNSIATSGRNDIIWARATATDYPSWGYMLAANKEEKIQADVSTTIAENWLGTASRCHTTLGAAIDEWFYWGLAGIQPDESAPGYEKIVLKPYLPADLPWVKASLQTARGTIACDWEQDGRIATLNITVPANSTATVHIPAPDPGTITERGLPAAAAEGVALLRTESGACVFEVGSGVFCFEFPAHSGTPQ
ncbi:MAG: family 78 glycoside hydrolase catalytic domain [Verrucomicrobia bacterium]|nr:family 78 glycoside hydrolase catalytic domain [Verrucomicrobiota bacterium]